METPSVEKARRISKLEAQITKRRAEISDANWESLFRVYRAYGANGKELVTLIVTPDRNPEVAIAWMRLDKNAPPWDGYFDDLFRALHNYLSILTTLIDHSRNLVRRYTTTSFSDAYMNRISSLSQMHVAGFLKDLRNYLLHYRMAPFTITTSMTQQQPFSVQVLLDAPKLLEWDKWTKNSETYLRSRDKIVLVDCILEYTKHIEELYSWMFSQIGAAHTEALDELQALQEEVRTLEDDQGSK